jgi:chromosome segregation ATPase
MDKTPEELSKELEQLRAERDALAASKARVEEENAKSKKRASEFESKLNEAEKKKLEEENNLHELVKREREEKQKIEDSYLKLKNVTLKEKLKSEVSKIAKDAHDIEDILRVVEARESLKIDEDSLTIGGVEDFVTKVRGLKPHLFAKSSMKSNEDNPPKSENGKGETKEEAYLRELKLAKSQKDFDIIRKKYGKSY